MPENATLGWQVFAAHAQDADVDENAHVTYSFVTNTDMFKLDPETGSVTLAQLFDQSQREYELRIRASDNGSPVLTSEQVVVLQLAGVNDHAPMFENGAYELRLREDEPVNNRFAQLVANDADSGADGSVSYHVEGGTGSEMFGLFPDGWLYVKRPLDRELQDLYVLVVVATDGGVPARQSSVNVTVHVTDANDNTPTFTNVTYTFHVAEEIEAGALVGVLSAADGDRDANGDVSYALQGAEAGAFTVGRKSGVLLTRGRFDREALVRERGASFFSLTGIASDGGDPQRTSRCVINIFVDDVNDNAPAFSRSFFEESILEDAQPGSFVTSLTAEDRDVDANANLTYAIVAGNDDVTFAIDPASGVVTLTGSLDREEQVYFRLTVQARDDGVPSLSADVTLLLRVRDVNDNAPVFVEDSVQEVTLAEDAVIGQIVTRVRATDADDFDNAQVTYDFADTSAATPFTLDPTSGIIQLRQALDFESVASYSLDIVATDSGADALTSEVTLVVRVSDVNDNAPRFIDVTDGRLNENAAPQEVMQVRATDDDVSDVLQFAIVRQSPEGNDFEIDATTGVLRSVTSLDREEHDSYVLTISVSDATTPETGHTTTRDVTININDVNDNNPVITSQNAFSFFMQDALTTARFASVTSQDADIVTQLQYSIDDNDFSVDAQNGGLNLTSNAKQRVFHRVEVSVSDGERSSSLPVAIFMRTEGEDGPEFAQAQYSAQVAEGSTPSSLVQLQLRDASDRNNNNIRYVITSVQDGSGNDMPRWFSVDEVGGVISVSNAIDREAMSDVSNVLEVEVHVIDTGASTSAPRTRSTVVSYTFFSSQNYPPNV